MSSHLQFCTIVCRNYLAQARVLAHSLAATYPASTLRVLVIDHPGACQDLYAGEPFELLTLEGLNISGVEVMKSIYSAVEFATSVKPWLLETVIRACPEATGVVYLDPDIEVISPLVELEAMLDSSWCVLTPHFVAPNPRDGLTPSEQAILLAGTYNLGFIAVAPGPTAQAFLDWWKERLQADCLVDPPAGYFVDQRFVDLVPGLFDDVGILRHAGYNVAYWNAATRVLSMGESGPCANGVPLRFIHYSGFDPSAPSVLSKHQNRVDLLDRPDLVEFTRQYAIRLTAAGHENLRAIRYPFALSASGKTIGPASRSLYREFAATGFSESLFSLSGEAAFVAEASTPSIRFSHLTRAQAHLWELEGSVRAAFPDVGYRDAARYAKWFELAPTAASAFGDLVVQSASNRPLRSPIKPIASTGVNVVGYLNAALGVGEIARSIIHSLDYGGVPVSPVSLDVPGVAPVVPFASLPARGGFCFEQSVLCVNADMLPQVMSDYWDCGISEPYSTGVWWWELDEVPLHAKQALPLIDQLLVGSRFIGEALRRSTQKPVHIFPVPILERTTGPLSSVAPEIAEWWPEVFTFYFSFDCNSVIVRKNPDAVIQAFRLAFPEAGSAALVLKSINAEGHKVEYDALRISAEDRPDIHFFDGALSGEANASIMKMADCYVSLHRSEGLGLTMAEAMLAGKPVIASRYSGNLDFMTDSNSMLVDCGMVAVGRGAGPYPADALWADPDVEQAAHMMRRVFDDQVACRDLGRRGALSIRATNSVRAASESIIRALSR